MLMCGLTGVMASTVAPAGGSSAQTDVNHRFAALLSSLDQLAGEKEVRNALAECEQQVPDAPRNSELLLKASYLAYRIGWLFTRGEERKRYYLKCYEYAQRASAAAPGEYHVLLLLTVAKAKVVDYFPPGDQVRMAREMAVDAEKLVHWRGDDPNSLYLLSWLNFEIGRISAVNRMLAATFFGGLPEGLSVENAFKLLESAIRYRPDYLVYQYDLGYYLLRTGDREKAREQFMHIRAMQPRTPEERVYQRRAADKIRELESAVN